MTFKCETVLLTKLYDFAMEHHKDAEAVRLERTELGNQYSKFCEDVTERVDEAQGFYLWGTYNDKRLWENIYLGMAGYGNHKSLRKRIREELMDERCCVWRLVYTRDELDAIRVKIYEGRYRTEWERGMRKAGSTHIVWVSAPGIVPGHVKDVEADLIEALNPRANRRRLPPPDYLQPEAKEIFGCFRECIHKNRQGRFLIQPKGGLSAEELATR
jgi:hypothetical protein